MSNNIVLIGFMGTGKDSVGRKIAEKTGMIFFSTDKYIEFKEKKTIKKIFKELGEGYFRKLERKAILENIDLKNTVWATGGGIVINDKNRRLLSKIGHVIHLDTKLEALEDRLKGDMKRPLIKNKENIRKIFNRRINLYQFAELKIDTSNKSPGEIADEIIKKLRITKKSKDCPTDSILLKTEHKQYPVHIGCHSIVRNAKIRKYLNSNSKRAVVITNTLVGALYLKPLENELKNSGIEPIIFIVPDGETHKNIKTSIKIYDFLLKKKIDRKEPLIALGGGVIGDISGFVASTYKRGIPFVQIPTTLLSQVDSSIGGKTGINHNLGKNMIGTFYQPDLVLIDVGVLLSLPEKEYKNGLAEVIKYGIIKDQSLFSLLIKKKNEILARNIKILSKVVSRCVRIKKEFVEKDEQERKGKREVLNFGHTIGHVIETLTKYSHFRHGEAVSIGMIEESRIAVKNGLLENKDFENIVNLISSYGLPISMPDDIPLDDIKNLIRQDKKASNGRIRLPIPTGIGRVHLKEVRCENFL